MNWYLGHFYLALHTQKHSANPVIEIEGMSVGSSKVEYRREDGRLETIVFADRWVDDWSYMF